MTSTFSHAINRPGANVRKGSDVGPAIKNLRDGGLTYWGSRLLCFHGKWRFRSDIPTEPVTVSQRKNWDPGSETSPLLEENTSLSGLAAKSGRGPQTGLRGRCQQTFPGGLVVRIRRSHRRGPGSIPGQGMSFCPPKAVVIAKCRTTNSSDPRKCLRVKKTSFEPESNQRPKDCQLATYSPPLYQLSYRRHTGW